MISIRVDELTTDILAASEYWRIYSRAPNGYVWADVRNRNQLSLEVSEDTSCPLMDIAEHSIYHGTSLCFPVSISIDGTETRLQCPKMPEETKIEWQWFGENKHPLLRVMKYGIRWWVVLASDGGISIKQKAPTPLHYPRLTCDSGYVWSQRKSIT